MSAERIVSLVPAATELLFELGLGDRLQAVSHACDHPPEARELPIATRTRLDPEGASREIDEAVRARQEDGEPMFEVLGEVLHHAQPDLVVVQEACEVCGITPVDVEATLARIEPVDRPAFITLHPHTLADVLGGVEELAEACGVPERGRELVDGLQARIDTVQAFADEQGETPRVGALDWLDPPMAAGHWIPGMIEAAGGRPVILEDEEPSCYVDWSDVLEAEPEVLLLIPCGFDTERTRREAGALAAREGWEQLPAVETGGVVTMDADSYTSRPGPRLVDGLEQIACLLHGEEARARWPEQADRVRRLETSS